MGDWWDEYLGYFGDSTEVAVELADTGSDINWDDIVSDVGGSYDDAVNVANDYNNTYGGQSSYEDAGYSNEALSENNSGDPYNSQPTYNSPLALSNQGAEKEVSLFDQAAGFVDKNKKLTDMGLGLIGSAYNSREKKKEDAKAYERMLEKRAYDEKIQKEKEDRADARRGGGGGGSSALELLAAKEAIDAANKAKFNQSITGLRPVGLINKGKKLTYVGGKPVYNDSGQLA